MEKNLIDSQGIQTLAKLPSKEVLLAKVVGGFQAPLYGLVNVMQGPLRKLVYVLAAIKDKKGV
jgi:large subunit ribosomal protein L10